MRQKPDFDDGFVVKYQMVDFLFETRLIWLVL